jgi:hypothetical protein
LIAGVLFVVTSPSQLSQPRTDDAATSMSPIGGFFFSLVLGLATAGLGVYLFRGQGPTTKDVLARITAERQAANLRRVTQHRPQQSAVVVNVGTQTSNDATTAAQISAIASPQTAQALQNLQNLLYTQAITDAEFQSAKDKLLGDARAHPAGWYDDGSGRGRWWDGRQWTDQFRDDAPVEGPVMSVRAEIGGQNANVVVFRERIEWVRRVGVSGGKVAAGILTGGVSLAVTGVGKGSYGAGGVSGSDGIWLTARTRASAAKAGGRTVVTVSTPERTVPMRLTHGEAQRLMQALNVLIAHAAREASSDGRPVVVQVTAPAAGPAVPTPAAAIDTMAQLTQLAELHRAGVLSDAEFTAAKAKALGLDPGADAR